MNVLADWEVGNFNLMSMMFTLIHSTIMVIMEFHSCCSDVWIPWVTGHCSRSLYNNWQFAIWATARTSFVCLSQAASTPHIGEVFKLCPSNNWCEFWYVSLVHISITLFFLVDGTLCRLWSSWYKKGNCWPELSWYFLFWNSEKGRKS
jgi:hypothetical protein